MVKIKTNNPHMSVEELDVTEEKAEQLVNSGNYIYVNKVKETIEEETQNEEE